MAFKSKPLIFSNMLITLFILWKHISDVNYWMIENKLQLNYEKTECLLISPSKCTHNLNCTSLSFVHNVISFSTTAKSCRFHFTDDMKIDVHVKDICRNVYIDIRRISSIRHLLSIDAAKTLLSTFVLPKLHYCIIVDSMVAQCICWKDFRRFKTQQQD